VLSLPEKKCGILSNTTSAIRWAGFKEYIYGTAIQTLVTGGNVHTNLPIFEYAYLPGGSGWGQIKIPSREVFTRSSGLGTKTTMMAHVLHNETDSYFAWQYSHRANCPEGCGRVEGICMPGGVKEELGDVEL
jgi:hypothetical protein